MMTQKILAAAFALGLAGAAQAEEISIAQPLTAGSLHEAGVTMTVYYDDATETAADVVATYVENGRGTAPARLYMTLETGDQVAFALPGKPQTLYSFAMTDEGLTVATASVATQLTN